jgi:2-methylisoborneol synthase
VPVLSLVSAPAATHDLVGVVVVLLSNPERAAPRDLHGSVGDQPTGDEKRRQAAPVVGRLLTGPTGLGTSAARIPWRCTAVGETVAVTGSGAEPHLSEGSTGVGASAARVSTERPAGGGSDSELYCPPAFRDDKALGEEVNDRWSTGPSRSGFTPDSFTACGRPISDV